MATPIPCQEQLTTVAAVAFILSVGVVSTVQSVGTHSLLALSAVAFVTLYVCG
ncbi:hypothetical protein ACFO5R_20645 [Halosolutus amylolyticus]|uniref:NADH dehydrogenase subunit 6 n=1 Tax=Halosolutus amylolyticus TaxID=2932267 RepID=A0ABD5PV50_9EURY|nr:hypothetical protein [Halosolutus amylolyticus]